MKTSIPAFLSVVVLTIGFVVSANAQDAKLPKWLPPNFDPKNGILLIEKAPAYLPGQKKIEKYMEKNYPYKYEFVTLGLAGNSNESTIFNAEKYTDKNIYRFIMVNSSTIIKGIPKSDGHQSQGSLYDYAFIDRLNDKAYPATGSATSWPNQAFERIMSKILKLKTE
jgi:hypothetical protein